jgi:hypothetical protein
MMSKKSLKDLIKNQAEEAINRIQDDYKWRNALFEDNPMSVANTTDGVDETPPVVNNTPDDAKGTYLETEDVPTFDSNITQILISNDVDETPRSFSNTPETNTMTTSKDAIAEIIPKIDVTPDGINKTPIGDDITPEGVSKTPGDYKTPNGVTKIPEIDTVVPPKDAIAETITETTVTPYGINKTPTGDNITPSGVDKTPDKEAQKKTTHGSQKRLAKKDIEKIPFLGKTNDLYLIGLWYVLKAIFKDGYGNYTLRGLAKQLQMDHSNLLRSLNRAEDAGLIHRFSSNEGTYIEIMTDLVLFPMEQHENTLSSFMSRFNDPNFQKNFQLKENLFGIFWAILAAHRQPEELSGSTFEILIKLSLQRDEYYVAAFIFKYLPRAKSNPASFFKAILEKENDPLSTVELEQGKQMVSSARNLIKSDPEAIGLATMRTIGKRFFLDMGGSLEECKQILQEIKQRYDNLVQLFQKPEIGSTTQNLTS